MGAMASQITSHTTVYSIVHSGADQRKHQKAPRHWPLCGEFAGDRWIPGEMFSNAENVSIWWRHHAAFPCLALPCLARPGPVRPGPCSFYVSVGHLRSFLAVILPNHTDSYRYNLIILFILEAGWESETDNNIFIMDSVYLWSMLHQIHTLTHLPLDKMAAISQTIFSDAHL